LLRFYLLDEEDAKITLEAKNPLTFGNVEFRDDYKALSNIFFGNQN
jgi:hypothetical protein